ncbi:hypothetical protein Tco_0606544 [Tanacetum coccineum]
MWSLDHLPISVQSKGLYKTTPPSPRVIKSFIQIPRQGQETHTKNEKTIIVDAIVDENDDDSFHSNSSSSPSQNGSSSSNVVPKVTQNPPDESHYMNTHLFETINLQTQQRDAHREGLSQ